jgi:hypothetical protein
MLADHSIQIWRHRSWSISWWCKGSSSTWIIYVIGEAAVSILINWKPESLHVYLSRSDIAKAPAGVVDEETTENAAIVTTKAIATI